MHAALSRACLHGAFCNEQAVCMLCFAGCTEIKRNLATPPHPDAAFEMYAAVSQSHLCCALQAAYAAEIKRNLTTILLEVTDQLFGESSPAHQTTND